MYRHISFFDNVEFSKSRSCDCPSLSLLRNLIIHLFQNVPLALHENEKVLPFHR